MQFVAPSKKLTLPAGVPVALVTVAVIVTAPPYVDGFGDPLTSVVVAGLMKFTAAVCVMTIPSLESVAVYVTVSGTVSVTLKLA